MENSIQAQTSQNLNTTKNESKEQQNEGISQHLNRRNIQKEAGKEQDKKNKNSEQSQHPTAIKTESEASSQQQSPVGKQSFFIQKNKKTGIISNLIKKNNQEVEQIDPNQISYENFTKVVYQPYQLAEMLRKGHKVKL